MKKLGAHFAIAAFASIALASPPAFGLRIGPLHLGVPFFGHRHHHHPSYMHGNTNNVAHDSQSAPQQRPTSLALLYPARALPPIFQNVFWPAFFSPWPFSYDTIFTTAFAAAPADRNQDDCRQSVDANAIVERLRAEIGPSAEQMEHLQRLGGALGAAGDYLAKSCPTEIPQQPTARLQLMDSQIEMLTMAVDIIHQPLEEFEQSLTDEQRAKVQRRSGQERGFRTPRQDEPSLLRRPFSGDRLVDRPNRQIGSTERPTAIRLDGRTPGVPQGRIRS